MPSDCHCLTFTALSWSGDLKVTSPLLYVTFFSQSVSPTPTRFWQDSGPFSKFYVVTEEVGLEHLGSSQVPGIARNLTFQKGKGQTAFSEPWAAMLCAGGASWVHT